MTCFALSFAHDHFEDEWCACAPFVASWITRKENRGFQEPRFSLVVRCACCKRGIATCHRRHRPGSTAAIASIASRNFTTKAANWLYRGALDRGGEHCNVVAHFCACGPHQRPHSSQASMYSSKNLSNRSPSAISSASGFAVDVGFAPEQPSPLRFVQHGTDLGFGACSGTSSHDPRSAHPTAPVRVVPSDVGCKFHGRRVGIAPPLPR